MCMHSVGGLDLEAESEKRLARLIEEHLGVKIEPKELSRFLRSKWTVVSILAHRIHDAGHPATKGGQQWQTRTL